MRGFLPEINPLSEYSIASVPLTRLQEIAGNLPKLLLTGKVPSTLESLQCDDLSVDDLVVNNLNHKIIPESTVNTPSAENNLSNQ